MFSNKFSHYICRGLVPGQKTRDEKGNRCKSGAIPVAVRNPRFLV